jgi:hypothetical protein
MRGVEDFGLLAMTSPGIKAGTKASPPLIILDISENENYFHLIMPEW